MWIPGLSGANTACLLEVYEPILKAVARYKENSRANLFYIVCSVIGCIAGCAVFTLFVSDLVEEKNLFFLCLVISATLISAVYLLFKNRVSLTKPKNLLFFIAGFGISPALSFAITRFSLAIPDKTVLFYPLLFVSGIVLAAALILPGISFSMMLYSFGLYDLLFKALKNFELLFLLILTAGIIGGILIFSRLINRCFEKYNVYTYSTIVGFLFYTAVSLIFGL